MYTMFGNGIMPVQRLSVIVADLVLLSGVCFAVRYILPSMYTALAFWVTIRDLSAIASERQYGIVGTISKALQAPEKQHCMVRIPVCRFACFVPAR